MLLEHKLIAFKREFYLKVNSMVLPSCQESLKIHYISSQDKDILSINRNLYIQQMPSEREHSLYYLNYILSTISRILQ